MTINFTREHMADAKEPALLCYQEERSRVPVLPGAAELPDLSYYADNGLGVAVFSPWELTRRYRKTERKHRFIQDILLKAGMYSERRPHGFSRTRVKHIPRDRSIHAAHHILR